MVAAAKGPSPVFASALTLILLASAAAAHTGPALSSQRLRFKHLTTDDGLAHGVVKSILQDSRGFMWFGTWGGLDRFDGYEFKAFEHRDDDPASLAGNVVNALLEDRGGVLWVGTSTGLSRFDRDTGKFKSYRHDPGDPRSLGASEVWSLLEDRDGELWVLTLGGGLNRLDRENDDFRRYAHEPNDPSTLSSNIGRTLCEDHLGYLWIGTDDGGLNRLDRATGEVTRFAHDPDDPGSLAGDDVWSVFEDSRNTLWVGTRTHGLNRFDRETGRFVRYPGGPDAPTGLAGNFILTMAEDRAGTLWIGVFDAGLHHYDRTADRFVRHPPVPGDPDSPSHFQVTAICEGDSGDLWIGTFGVGVDRLDRSAPPFGFYEHDPGNSSSLGGRDVRAVHEDAEGIFWIGTYDAGLTRFDRERSAYAHYRHDPADPASLSDDRIHVLHEDRQGRLWIGTWGGGLNRFDRATGTFRSYRHDPGAADSLSDDDVRGIHEDRDGVLWIATRSGGVDRLDPGRDGFTHHLPDPADPHKIDDKVIFTLAGGEPGILWLGLWGGGLDRFETATGTVTRYYAAAGDPNAISSNEVWAIYPAEEGRLWLGTSGGLDRFDPGTGVFVHYREEDGLADDAVYDVIADDRGDLWLTTGVGLSRFDPRSGRFRNFNGLEAGNFFDGCAYRSRSGEIWIGGKEGLLFFRPDEIVDSSYVPPVVLTDFRIFNESVEIGGAGSPLAKDIEETDRLTLTSDQSVFTITFAALDYRDPEKNLYAYKLDGLEEKWNEVGSGRRHATYTNLDPGSYTFRVRGSNRDGVWSSQDRSLEIRVRPPFWGTWWFRSGLAVAIAGLVWGGYSVRTSSIRAHNRALQAEIRERRHAEEERERLISELGSRNAELERFVYTVSHDLRTPLVTIKGFLGFLIQDADAGKMDALRHDADVIGDAASKMQVLLDDLLELSRIGRVVNPPEAVDLGELAREAVDLAAGRIWERGVEVVIAEPMPEIWGDRVRLLEVLQNLVDNAVKFMGPQPSPRVEVRGTVDGSEVLCSVADNGIGIARQHHESIFGLFDRLDPAIEGTGVGLALVKRIVEVHGGRIWVESEGAGKGSEFFFTLPRRPEDVRGVRIGAVDS